MKVNNAWVIEVNGHGIFLLKGSELQAEYLRKFKEDICGSTAYKRKALFTESKKDDPKRGIKPRERINSTITELLPKEGQEIYVPTSVYLYRGKDDFIGGKAIISMIVYNKNLDDDHYNKIMISIKERPNVGYNWNALLEKQEELKKEFNDQLAHPDPDLDPEFNQPNADWK